MTGMCSAIPLSWAIQSGVAAPWAPDASRENQVAVSIAGFASEYLILIRFGLLRP
jgi:hypothetical protein